MVQSKAILKEAVNSGIPDEGVEITPATIRNALLNIIDSYKDEVVTLSQAEIDAIVSPQLKQLVYNSDLGELQIYLGGWATILTATTSTRTDELYYTFSVTFDGEAGSGAEGDVTLPVMLVPSSFVCYQTIWSAAGMSLGSEVIYFGVATDSTNSIFGKDLDEIDEEATKVDMPSGNLTKTTAQRLIVGNVAGGDVTQGTLTITAKFIRV